MSPAFIPIPAPDDLPAVLAALRQVLVRGLDPDEVQWGDASQRQGSFLEGDAGDAQVALRDERTTEAAELRLPRGLVELLRSALLHDSPERLRIAHGLAADVLRDRRVWDDTLRDDRLRLERMAREVRREIHKMHAFVRFRPVHDDEGECHVAWFEPAHHVVRAAASHFVDRFAGMRWAILTPRGSVRWDLQALRFGMPASRADAPGADAGEALWLTYYRSVFNPARLKPAMMRREMPVRFWRNLPEATQITGLMQQAGSRTHAMQSQVTPERARRVGRALQPSGGACGSHGSPASACGSGPAQPVSPSSMLELLARQASACDACAFAADATQVVWGEGMAGAALMLVGEQPGDQEDLAGRPFVGPAGQLLHRAIDALRWPRESLYFTNAVKHFKYTWRGKRRFHKTAAQREAEACAHWLEGEIAAVRPRAVVALGRTALGSLLQAPTSVEAHAGQWLHRPGDGLPVYVMPHPAAVLRAGGADLQRREAEWTALLAAAGQVLHDTLPSG